MKAVILIFLGLYFLEFAVVSRGFWLALRKENDYSKNGLRLMFAIFIISAIASISLITAGVMNI